MAPNIGVNLRVTGHCNQGDRRYMEDVFSVAYQQTEDEKDLEYAFFGIFDGHGGREAAQFAKDNLMDFVVSQKNFWSDDDELVLKAIREGFITTHQAMWKELGDDPRHWHARPLTRDHKPESVDECERIQQCGGKVINKSGVPRVVWNRPRIGHQGPIRRSTEIDEIPFLAVARSLGDLWSFNSSNNEYVVSPEPDLDVLTVDVTQHRCLVLGTDGFWNMVSPQQSVSNVAHAELFNEECLINHTNTGEERQWINPSKRLVDLALSKWKMKCLRADNTSVVTVMLDPPGPPKVQVVKKRLRQSSESEQSSAAKRPADEAATTAGQLAERAKAAARFRPAFFRSGGAEPRVPGASPLRDYKVFNPVGALKPALVGRRSCPQPMTAPPPPPPPRVPPPAATAPLPLLAAMSASLPAPPPERRDVQINEVTSSSCARRAPPPAGEDSDTENRAAPGRPVRRRSAPPAGAASVPARAPAPLAAVRRSPSAELLQKVRRKTDELSQHVRQLRSSFSTPPRTRRSALRSHNGDAPPPPPTAVSRKRRSSETARPERPAKKPVTRSRIRLGK
ncbi:Protein phosphatase 1D [Amphibalanus amphitrite]|uniref:Protein phosphatase 1D n=1 Tax=Amphibalanus amphitrite TaxID=1232801 RepID=A0A6A4X2B0_AMPAM|nr:Protein phosphatase 1D [Amphibalanus amphitrite]